MDIFELFNTISDLKDTKKQATLDYLNGKIDSDTYIKRMSDIEKSSRRTN